MSANEPFSNVDAAWLHMDEPTNMAMIVGILRFDERLDFDRFKTIIATRLLLVKRFRQRVQEPWLGVGTPHWELDPSFDLDAHLRRVSLPPPGDQAALQDLVSELIATPLDHTRPLWQWHFVDNFGKGSALILRVHHCIADGLAMVRVLLMLTDESPDAVWQAPHTKSPATHNALSNALRPVTRLASTSLHTAETIVHEGMETLVHPGRLGDAALMGTSGTLALGKLLLIGPDSKTIFKGQCGISKRAAWSQPIPLADVKAVGMQAGTTINDILMACVTGALRRYMEGCAEPTAGLDIRAIVPVNLRPLDEPLDLENLGNRFGLVFLSLPIGVVEPRERLAILKERMDDIKHTPEAVVAFGILNAMGMTPIEIEKIIMTIFGIKGTAVMSNVPGPRKVLYLAGKPIRGMMYWVPTPAHLGLGISILSYAGEVSLGIATDEGLVPDPELIVAGFKSEFAALKRQFRTPRVQSKKTTRRTPLQGGATRVRKPRRADKPNAEQGEG